MKACSWNINYSIKKKRNLHYLVHVLMQTWSLSLDNYKDLVLKRKRSQIDVT